VGVEPTILAAKDRINGFEGHEDHRTLFASVVHKANRLLGLLDVHNAGLSAIGSGATGVSVGLAIRATASCKLEIDKWAYRRVMAKPLCPSNSAMLPSGVPGASWALRGILPKTSWIPFGVVGSWPSQIT
jgi:hypothetical protein